MTEVTTEMPRSRSIFIQSERVLRRSPLALTWPARLMAPPNSSSFSVSVVLPASGCEMIAKVRRRATSAEIGEWDGDSAVRARSDISERLAGKTGAIKGFWAQQRRCAGSRTTSYRCCEDDLQSITIRRDDPARADARRAPGKAPPWLGYCCSSPD